MVLEGAHRREGKEKDLVAVTEVTGHCQEAEIDHLKNEVVISEDAHGPEDEGTNNDRERDQLVVPTSPDASENTHVMSSGRTPER